MTAVWKELTQTLLFGVSRKPLSPPLKEALAAEGLDVSNPDQQLLLDGLTAFYLYRKAAMEVPVLKTHLPEPPDLQAEQLCSARSARHLEQIMDGKFEAALEEFLHYLRQAQKSLPPEVLPELLEKALQKPEIWEKMAAAIGPRGVWLASQHPDWQTLKLEADEEAWQYGSLPERVRYLRILRKQNPEQAVEAMQEVWPQEDSKSKKALLECLEINLAQADEKFLEFCLDDRHKNTRLTAARLLAKLPDSNLQKRLKNLSEQWIQFDGKTMKFELPNQLNKAIIRDGIQEGPKKMVSPERKEHWLRQLAAMLPPTYWEERIHFEAPEALRILVRNKQVFLNGIIEAILLHKDKKWAGVLSRYWLQNNNPEQWKGKDALAVLRLLSNKDFNSIGLQYFKNYPYPLDQEHFVSHLLSLGAHRWEDELSRLFVRNMQEWLEGVSSWYAEDQPYLSIIKQAAYHCNPQLFSSLQHGWRYKNRAALKWEKRIERFLNTLLFRKEMIRELS